MSLTNIYSLWYNIIKEVITINIGDRICKLRKTLDITQADFAAAINISRSNLSNIEGNRFNITDRFLADVCRVYNVNQEWLMTGTGEMFRDTSRQEKVAAFVGEALADENNDFRANLISILAGLDADGWETLKKAAIIIADAAKKEGG